MSAATLLAPSLSTTPKSGERVISPDVHDLLSQPFYTDEGVSMADYAVLGYRGESNTIGSLAAANLRDQLKALNGAELDDFIANPHHYLGLVAVRNAALREEPGMAKWITDRQRTMGRAPGEQPIRRIHMPFDWFATAETPDFHVVNVDTTELSRRSVETVDAELVTPLQAGMPHRLPRPHGQPSTYYGGFYQGGRNARQTKATAPAGRPAAPTGPANRYQGWIKKGLARVGQILRPGTGRHHRPRKIAYLM